MSASWTSYSTFTRCIRHESTEAACTDAAAPRKAYYILDELFIKYAVNMHVGPEMRLAMATATLIYTVHSANSGNATVARAMEAMSRQAPTAATDL